MQKFNLINPIKFTEFYTKQYNNKNQFDGCFIYPKKLCETANLRHHVGNK